ncbi:hypothetical protein JKF63_05520 [Porcisia hertigi]|uniref:Cytidyltransferase-like domain-containing protein n=1 Tax=Porcisia hertigi TaxID=2761500 RepID=A0A836LDQ0_9TRYP|nr:hypothetical protein JKF63_05520 [Porcisia hertigi]
MTSGSRGISCPTTAVPYALRTDKLKPLECCVVRCHDPETEAAFQATPIPSPVVLAICGSFNPIHNAHLKLYDAAKQAVDGVDGRVVLGGFLSPVSDAYGKPGLLCAADRVRIMEKALRHHTDLNVDTWECQQLTYTRTFFALQALEEHVNAWYAQSEPAAVEWLAAHGRRVNIIFVCGADLFSSFWIPGCWPLRVLRKLLSAFRLVVVNRKDAQGSVSGVIDVARLCREGPPLSETAADGETVEIDMSKYAFTFTAFSAPDDTSSTAVRSAAAELSKTPPEDVETRAALQLRLRDMLPDAAVQLVVDLYG